MYLKVIPEKKCVCVGGVVKAPPPPIAPPSLQSLFPLLVQGFSCLYF